MAVKTTRYDTSEYLDSEEKIAAYMDAVLDDGDPALVTHALALPPAHAVWRNRTRDGAFKGKPISRAQRRRKSRTRDGAKSAEGAGHSTLGRARDT